MEITNFEIENNMLYVVNDVHDGVFVYSDDGEFRVTQEINNSTVEYWPMEGAWDP